MAIYELHISDRPVNRYLKWGSLQYILIQDKKYTKEQIWKEDKDFYELFDEVEEMVVIIEDGGGKKPNPYPNLLSIDIQFCGIDKKAQELLQSLDIKFKTKPIKILNKTEVEYKWVYFPDLPLLDLDQSNAEMKGRQAVTKGRNDYDSPIILNSNVENINGIVRISELQNILICTEDIKKAFEKNNIEGCYFSKVEYTL